LLCFEVKDLQARGWVSVHPRDEGPTAK